MTYTLRDAIADCGHSKSSILGALKSGTISDTRNAHDGWQLEPVELHRLLPAASPARTLQRNLELAEERVSRVEAELRLALAEARVSRVQAELADVQRPRDAWNSQPGAQLFDEEVVIKEVLDALPHGSAITFSADQLEVLLSGGGPVLADTKTAATLAHTCGCSFALHGDTGTFTKNFIDTAASAQMNVPRSPIQIGFEEEKPDKMFGKSKGSSHEEDKLLPPVQQLQNLAPAHLAASEPAANSSIGAGMTIVGKISSEGIVNVFGRVEGELHASTVRISDGAQVEGTIAKLTIGGRFKGTIQANRVTLTSSAVVEGEKHYRSLAIDENAWFAGLSRPEEASASGTDARSPIQLMPTDGNRQVNGSLAQPNFSPMLPVVEPSNKLVFDCKTHGNGYRTTKEGLPNAQYEPRGFQLYSAGSRDQSAKRISRGSLQIAILALTVGATTGAGAVLALVGHPSHQYIPSLTARPPAIIQQAANLPAPEPASDGRRKVSDETPEHAAPPWPVPLDAYASPAMNSPSSQISGAPDHLGQMTNRTSALDMPRSLADAANKEDARHTGRKTSRYISTHRFTHWQHRYRHAFHRYAFWRRYRYAFHSLRKGWI